MHGVRFRVGKSEMGIFYLLYALTCVFQALTTGSFLHQGGTPLVWITAVHIGLIVALFWVLLFLGILTLQVLEVRRLIH
jgi:hypothetical protein